MDGRGQVGKGEAPWEKMSEEELERQYSPSRWAVHRGPEEALRTYERKGAQATAEARATTRNLLGVPYGAREAERLDVYLPERESEAWPLLVFFHGGYWQSGSRDDSAFMARPLTARGVAVAVVGYDIAPTGSLDLMVDQAARSVVFVQKRFPDNRGVYLCGHSAGAHLAAMMLLADWTRLGATPNLKGLFLLSGLYDLAPILRTSMNEPLHLTPEDAARNSPQRRLAESLTRPGEPTPRILVALGQYDSPEFQRQSREFYQMLRRRGWKASLEEIADVDHFEILWNLMWEDDTLTQIILDTIFRSSDRA